MAAVSDINEWIPHLNDKDLAWLRDELKANLAKVEAEAAKRWRGCWNCLHPVDFHEDGRGCQAGLHATPGTLPALLGCSCALEPAAAAEGAP